MAVNTEAQSSRQTKKAVKKSAKHWVAVTMFVAIIVVFVFWGIHPSQYGDSAGGVAAIVNDTPVSLSEFRNRVEVMEQNLKFRMGDIPEEQRKMFNMRIRQQALEDLIETELLYQAANRRGITAADSEVRDNLLQIPAFQEDGRFQKDRYRAYLQNVNLSGDQFERWIRKQIVDQKVQELFLGAASPTQEEIDRTRVLNEQKIKVRFVTIREQDLLKSKLIGDQDVANFLKANGPEVETYYKSNPVEFTTVEKVQAKHILIRIDEKRSESEALKKAQVLHKELTAANFSKKASEISEDPGSKAKGGELGEFERGKMLPEFENAAFGLKEGEISQPIKTSYGYHIILTEKKSIGGLQPLDKVQKAIARKLLARSKQTEILDKAKNLVASGNKGEVDAWVAKSQLKWEDSGEFDLSADGVPKLEGSSDAMRFILKLHRPGLVPELVSTGEGHAIIDIQAWQKANGKSQKGIGQQEAMGSEKMIAYRKSNDMKQAWSAEIMSRADIERNPRLLQQ